MSTKSERNAAFRAAAKALALEWCRAVTPKGFGFHMYPDPERLELLDAAAEEFADREPSGAPLDAEAVHAVMNSEGGFYAIRRADEMPDKLGPDDVYEPALARALVH